MRRGLARDDDHEGDDHEDEAVVVALRAALRPDRPMGEEAAQQAVAAFRAARDAGLHSGTGAPRTRRRDDWRPVAERRWGRWSKAALVALVSGLTLGGVAVATGGLPSPVSDAPEHRPEPSADAVVPTPRKGAVPPAPPSVRAPSTPPVADAGGVPGPNRTERVPPGAARSHEALCRSYEQKAVRAGGTWDPTALRRLVEAAGGEEAVPAYCERLTDRTKARDENLRGAARDDRDHDPRHPEGKKAPGRP
ncbi:hypothetical protein [Streptomyces sp. NPDC015130]|uniref:hypothetical protein n=1 Tax=Streptomyces sp. NPDC015130 TaxID=3364940 RepID=UPI0036FDEE85